MLADSPDEALPVSVVVPIFNMERHGEDFFVSLFAQTLEHIEIILVDDGSTDATPAIIAAYQEKDPRVRVIAQKRQGAGAARNAGYDVARGEYIAFLDADDLLEPHMLERLYGKAAETGADVVQCACKGLDVHTGSSINMDWAMEVGQIKQPRQEYFCPADLERSVFRFCNGWAWDKLFRREFVRKNGLRFQPLPYANDGYFVFMAMALAERIAVVEEYLITHRLNDASSVSNSREVAPRVFYEMLKAIRDDLVERGLYAAMRRGFLTWLSVYILWHYETLGTPHKYPLRSFLRTTVLPDLGLAELPAGFLYEPEPERKIRDICWDRSLGAPLVSLVVAGHNAAHRVDACLERILNQSYDNLEILFIDCGSTDATLDITRSLMEKSARFKLLAVSMPISEGKAFNLGLELATGDYVVFCRATELLPCTAIESLLRRALETGSDVAAAEPLPEYGTAALLKKETGNTFISDKEAEGMAMRHAVCLCDHIPSGMLYRCSFLREHELRFAEQESHLYSLSFCFKSSLLAGSIAVADPGGDYEREDLANAYWAKETTVSSFSLSEYMYPLHEIQQWLEASEHKTFYCQTMLALTVRIVPRLSRMIPAHAWPDLFLELQKNFKNYGIAALLSAAKQAGASRKAVKLALAAYYGDEREFFQILSLSLVKGLPGYQRTGSTFATA